MTDLKEYEFQGHKYIVEANASWDYEDEQQSRTKFLDLNPLDTFIDIGAYVGSWTIPAALMGAMVIAIEPASNSRDELIRNLTRNDITHVQVMPHLLSDGRYENILYDNWDIKPGEGTFSTTTLDDIIDLSVFKIKLIKIDVEGHELQVLRGAHRILKYSLPNVLVEVHNHLGVKTEDIIKFFNYIDEDYQHEIIPQDGGRYQHVYFTKEGK